MLNLLLATLAMMGLTFAIGFFVALVIKLIAVAANSLDFYSSHQQELLRLRRLKKLRHKVALLLHEVPTTAKVAQKIVTKENPDSFILGDALGANISGVITSAIITGIYITVIPYL